jgi:hypothetical protein
LEDGAARAQPTRNGRTGSRVGDGALGFWAAAREDPDTSVVQEVHSKVDHFKVSKSTRCAATWAAGIAALRREPRATKLDTYQQYIVTNSAAFSRHVARCSFSVVSAIEVCPVEVCADKAQGDMKFA